MIKRLLIVIFIFLSIENLNAQIMISEADSLNALKVGSDFKPTKYKAGFKYTTQRGEKMTLIEYIKDGQLFGVDLYRWRVKIEWLGVSVVAWTDDCWIDVATKKAYLNEKLHKIIYYE